MKTQQVIGRILIIERLTSSYSGNPRYRITLESTGTGDDWVAGGTWNTAADHSFNYEIGNRGRRVGDIVTLTIGGRGTIIDVSDVTS